MFSSSQFLRQTCEAFIRLPAQIKLSKGAFLRICYEWKANKEKIITPVIHANSLLLIIYQTNPWQSPALPRFEQIYLKLAGS